MTSLRIKIGSYFFIIVLLAWLTSAFAIYYFSEITNKFSIIINEQYTSVSAAQNMFKSLERQESAQLYMLLQDLDLGYIQFNANKNGFLGWLEKSKKQIKNKREDSILINISKQYSSYIFYSDSLYSILQNSSRIQVATAFKSKTIKPIADNLKNLCFDYLEINQTAMANTQELLNKATQDASVTVILISLFALIISIFTIAVFNKNILKPAEQLTNSVRKISQGQLNQKIDVNAEDEFGELGREFNKMTERLREYEMLNIQQLVTEKKKSETIVETIADPIIVTDCNNKLLLINQAAKVLLNIYDNNWKDKKIEDIITNKNILEVLKHQDNIKSEHQDKLLTLEINSATKYYIPRNTKIVDENNNVQGFLTLLQDVTKFKDIDKMKSEFIATVSHELRTPITSLGMGTDILLKNVVGKINSKQKELLNAAKDDIERLRKLVRDLLTMSKLESDKFETKKDVVDLTAIIDDTIKQHQLQFKEKNVTLEKYIPHKLPSIYADKNQLTWVINNLLNNALRFTEPEGKVTISANKKNKMIVVSVKDTGIGISAEYKKEIFEKFVQIKGATETTPGSVGLGLAIAKKVIEAHNGNIWLESTVGVGSTFYFSIPLDK